ncbi:MAG: hypothetical protein NZN28_04140 [Meiothermus sp.]|uniref:hypothetical protein n=1 Tax=Meiothermus sp. TaxID=1955249 RepID=UPI0025E3657B|nr:hypothetical protein [Meiothermus sp.]MCS7067813.1 hypothetical protein [Meiothermus sp.]
MGLDDLLGLLFLFFFIVLPALQGLLRRGQQMPPDFEPDEIPLPGEERRPPAQPRQAPPPQSSAPARPPAPTAPPARPPASTTSTRPPASQPGPPPRPKTPPAPRPKTLEEIERERLARTGARPAQEPPRPAPPAAKPKSKPPEPWAFSTTPHAILNGVVWHQVLAEPRSQYWRRVRKPKR